MLALPPVSRSGCHGGGASVQQTDALRWDRVQATTRRRTGASRDPWAWGLAQRGASPRPPSGNVKAGRVTQQFVARAAPRSVAGGLLVPSGLPDAGTTPPWGGARSVAWTVRTNGRSRRGGTAPRPNVAGTVLGLTRAPTDGVGGGFAEQGRCPWGPPSAEDRRWSGGLPVPLLGSGSGEGCNAPLGRRPNAPPSGAKSAGRAWRVGPAGR